MAQSRIGTAARADQKISTEATQKLAYQLWEKAGKPNGRDQEFYYEAEQQLRQQIDND